MQLTVQPISMLPSSAASVTASQLLQGVFRRENTQLPAPAQIPPFVQQAIVKLVNIVQTLCASDNDWPQDLPQTPENLVPYVSEETEELLDTLHQWQSVLPLHSSLQTAQQPSPADSPLELISDLGTHLVGSLAASTPETMGLLEGLAANLQIFPGAVQPQGVRLVPVLTVIFDDGQYELDLVTQTAFDSSSALPNDSLLQLSDRSSLIPPVSLACWREKLWAKAIAITPEIQQWQQEQTLQILLPGRTWEPIQCTLSLQFVILTRYGSLAALTENLPNLSSTGMQPLEMAI
ncbi:MAG: hypothetical protein F6K42_34520, partial [Leptolyngbya sp. SIO1D8]|nr:hypothetical protein [Leptolyngbya sp. SIO1D8]